MCKLYYYVKGLDVKRPVDLTNGIIAEIAICKVEQTL